jgi:Flp pilus assembly protein TadD
MLIAMHQSRLVVLSVLMAALLAGCGNAQSRKAAYLAHAKEYFAAANFEKARIELRNAGQFDPKDPEVHYLLGQVAEKSDNVREGYAQYSAALVSNPEYLDARAALGRIYLYVGLPAKAAEAAEIGLKSYPENPQLLMVRGGAESQQGNSKGALEDALKAYQLAPENDYVIGLLASIYRKSGDIAKATEVVDKAIAAKPTNAEFLAIRVDLAMAASRPDEAEKGLKAIIELQPAVLARRLDLVKFYAQQKKPEQAESAMREAVSALPDNNDAKADLVALVASLHGKPQAEDETTKFIAASPKNNSLKLSLAMVLARLGEGQKTEQMLREVIDRASTTPDGLAARDRLAGLLVERGDAAAASKLLEEVLAVSAHDNDALSLRAELAMSRGDSKSAVTDLRTVSRDQPSSISVLRALARAYGLGGESGQAEDVLRNALQLAPRDLNIQLDLAKLLSAEGKHDQSLALVSELTVANPTNPDGLELLFREQAQLKRFSEAGETAVRLEKLEPQQGLGFYFAGLAAEAQQKPADARKDFARALAIQPKASEPLTALVKLDLAEKHPEAAMARLDAVIAKYPSDPVVRATRGDLLLTLNRPAEAVSEFEQVTTLAPAWSRGYLGLAFAQYANKQTDPAVATLRGALEKTADDPTVATELANLYEKLGRTTDAVSLYEGLVAQKPDSVQFANNLAMLLVTYPQDSTSLSRAAKLSEMLATSSKVEIIDTRGWVKFKNGDFHGAESLLQQAVVESPRAGQFHYHLAMAQLKSGESQAAVENLEAAVNSAQPFAGLEEAKATLAQLKKTG